MTDGDLSVAELAWAAGLFDGEGCTYFQLRTQQKGRQRRYGYMTLAVSQTHPEVLERFCAAIGVGKVYGPYQQKKAQWNQFWKVCLHGDEVEFALTRLWPFLGTIKREQALVAFGKRRPYAERPKLRTGPKAATDVAA